MTKVIPPPEPDVFTEDAQSEILAAIDFATDRHRGQFRKGSGLPFIVHPMSVLTVIGTEWELRNLKVWKATICHDTKEDCGVTDEELIAVIGEDAASIVSELTFIPDPRDERPDHIQKRDYMRSFMQKSVDALVIKCADRFCNVCDWLSSDPEYAVKYWKKASDLMDAMFTRGEEISEAFGSDVFTMMKYTRSGLTAQLQR